MMMNQDESGISNPGFVQENFEMEVNGNKTHNGRVKVGEIRDEPDGSNDNPGCSLFGLIPLPFCKSFLTAPWLLVFLCWASNMQGMIINGYINVGITSIEKRFNLPSTQSGIIVGSYDIASLLTVIPISYFGGRLGSSKPRYIAAGLMLMGTGSLLFSLPHFITGRYEVDGQSLNSTSNKNPFSLCDITSAGNSNTESCQEVGNQLLQSLSSYRYFFIFGQMLHGIGANPLLTLGTTLLDQSVSPRNSPMYIGIFQTLFVVGPAIGYLSGGNFLGIHTDFHSFGEGEKSLLTPESTLWIGAWWLGFIVGWILCWCCAFFISLYPPTLPGTEKHNKVKPTDGFVSIKELPKALKALLTNLCYMFINLGGAMDGFTIASLSTFMPKYFEYQYGLTSAQAAMAVGAIVVPGGGGGTFVGGWVTRRFKLTRSGVIKFYLMCQVVTIPTIFGFFLYCPNPNFAGITKTYQGLELDPKAAVEFKSSCNQDCSCSDFNYNPVCGSDNVMYYNPCYAGCKDTFKSSDSKYVNFTDCSCISDALQQATNTSCDLNCSSNLIIFMIASFTLVFFTFASVMPSLVATLRAVEPVHRSLAVGVESIFTRIFGTIPGPILFGFIIDQACVLWEKDKCESDTQGSCFIYNNQAMAMAMMASVLVAKMLGIVFFGIGYFFSERSPIKDESIEE